MFHSKWFIWIQKSNLSCFGFTTNKKFKHYVPAVFKNFGYVKASADLKTVHHSAFLLQAFSHLSLTPLWHFQSILKAISGGTHIWVDGFYP